MRVHFVVHESFESAGAYLKWAEDRGYTISWSRVYAGEALPPNADEFDMLVVFMASVAAHHPRRVPIL